MISRTTKSFWRLYDDLPSDVQRQGTRAYALWLANPSHPSLQFKCINERGGVHSVRVGLHWRALATRRALGDQTVFTWFWIGSHAEYDGLISGR